MSQIQQTEAIVQSARREGEGIQSGPKNAIEEYQRPTMRVPRLEIVFGSALMVLLFGGFVTRIRIAPEQSVGIDDVFEDSLGI